GQEAARFVHERAACIDIIGTYASIYSGSGTEAKGCNAGIAADGTTGWGAAVDILLVSQLMIVVSGVIALPSEQGQQASLAPYVHGQELLEILPGEVCK